MNPDSYEELSCQVRLIWLTETADAERLDGAIGGAGLAAWREAVENRSKLPSNSRIQIRTERGAPRRGERFGVGLSDANRGVDTVVPDLGAVFPGARGWGLRERHKERHNTFQFPAAGDSPSAWHAIRSSSINKMLVCRFICFSVRFFQG